MAEEKGLRQTGKLAAVSLKNLGPGLHGDGGGLWLQVTPNRMVAAAINADTRWFWHGPDV